MRLNELYMYFLNCLLLCQEVVICRFLCWKRVFWISVKLVVETPLNAYNIIGSLPIREMKAASN